MANPNRRIFLEALALGAGTLAASQAGALDGRPREGGTTP
jgi:hypothetical protein